MLADQRRAGGVRGRMQVQHTVPWAIANAAYQRQRHNPAVTEIVKIPNRGHSLTVDHGWREVAKTALDFVERSRPRATDLDAPSAPRQLTPQNQRHEALKVIPLGRQDEKERPRQDEQALDRRPHSRRRTR